jgi:hypothetical protein
MNHTTIYIYILQVKFCIRHLYLNNILSYLMDHSDKKPDETNVDITDIDDFNKLLDLVRLDANLVDDLTDEQVTKLRKKLNPYGGTIEGKGTFTCLSVTNLSEQYMKRFLMTSLIGFLYRQCDEHELDDGEPTCPLDNYEEFMCNYNNALTEAKVSRDWLDMFWDTFEKDKLSEETLSSVQKAERLNHQRALDRGEGFKKRLIVRQFLDGLFQFNPDKHVRSAYSNNPLDPERITPAHVKPNNVNTEEHTKTLTGKSGKTMIINKTKESQELESVEEKRSNSSFVKHIPPADVFHRWTYYTESNYEEVRTAVQDLYADKPDLEFAVNPYGQFDSQEDAERFVQKHKNEVISDVLTLYNSKWNLTGSFKQNRERINFYNEKTAVIEEIFKQLEQDKKLGGDLMRKRVKRKKKKNVEESGPDPEEFKQYKKNNPSSFENMGAEDVSKDLTSATNSTFKIHEECPYDAVQVDVFDFKRGGQYVKKSEFFTETEDPEKIDNRK